ncbi:hypothetical protein HYQ46_002511 [Verticillium longisporum]|nr:hypothetical protein HYQ46_002511 [Verticillium longisporum]
MSVPSSGEADAEALGEMDPEDSLADEAPSVVLVDTPSRLPDKMLDTTGSNIVDSVTPLGQIDLSRWLKERHYELRCRSCASSPKYGQVFV